jgi:3-hydroxyacyl-[acyl-carrier-protein] dehydratase
MHIEYFQMVDRVESLDAEAGRVTCIANVPESSTIFEGHFPGHPLMPGTLLIEAMAQTSGYMLMHRVDFERLPFLIQVGRARLRTFVEPGTGLRVTGELEHDGSGFAVTNGEILRGDERIADAELRFRTMPFPTAELRDIVRDYAARLGVPS